MWGLFTILGKIDFVNNKDHNNPCKSEEMPKKVVDSFKSCFAKLNDSLTVKWRQALMNAIY